MTIQQSQAKLEQALKSQDRSTILHAFAERINESRERLRRNLKQLRDLDEWKKFADRHTKP